MMVLLSHENLTASTAPLFPPKRKRVIFSSRNFTAFFHRDRMQNILNLYITAHDEHVSLHVDHVPSLNGRDLGVAFVGFDTEGLYPAASMNVGQAAHFNFGYSPFLYNPMDSGASSFQPITEAVSATVAVHSDSIDNNTGVESFQAYQERTPMRPSDPLMAGGDVDGDDVDEGANGDVRRGIDEFSSRRDRERRGSGGDTEGRQGDNRSNNYGGSGNGVGATDGAGGGDAHLELQRQGLVENLIVMGFPVEWAMRAAERSGEPGTGN